MGKVAVITGGAGLLGKQHASALAEIGATVIITDIDENAAKNAVNNLNENLDAERVYAMSMDVTDLSSIKQVNEKLKSDHGDVHILVNNAAIDPNVDNKQGMVESSRLENFPLEQWQFQIEVGLTGAFLSSQIFGREMAKKGEYQSTLQFLCSNASVYMTGKNIIMDGGDPYGNR